MSVLEPGRVVGRYEIAALLGRGASGEVYRARDRALGREVAVKVLAYPLDDGARERFDQEARAVARIDHPGVVPVHDVGNVDGLPFIVMGLVTGGTLEDRTRGRSAPGLAEEGFLRQTLSIVRAVAETLDAVHRSGIVHRDLKPSNILLDSTGSPRITDFGLALVLDATRLTGTGETLGTPAFMPPEQARGDRDRIGPASDVYSLGATLYASVAGAPPYDGDTAWRVALQVLRQDPPPLRRRNPHAPRAVETICARAMCRDPGRRYPSAGALAQDIARFLSGEPIAARPPTVAERVGSFRRRRPAAFGVLVAATVGLAMAGILGWQWALTWKHSRQRDRALPWYTEAVALHRQAAATGDPAMAGDLRDRAALLLERAVLEDPRFAAGLVLRAALRAERGEARAAESDLDRALTLPGVDPEAHLDRARLRLTRGATGEARGDLERFLRLAPGHPRAGEASRILEEAGGR